MTMINHHLLFICTGNYYRSRYAELYFNDLSSRVGIPWSAFSRGLATEDSQNIGPISPKVILRLKEHEISTESQIRYPIQLTQADLETAKLAIALYEPEHRPLMQWRFPDWENRVLYWHVPDLDEVRSEVAFPRIEKQVMELLQQLPG